MASDTEVDDAEVRRLSFADRIRAAKDSLKRLNRGPIDVVVMDVGTTGIKVVRMKKGGVKPVLLGVAIPPPLKVSKSGGAEAGGTGAQPLGCRSVRDKSGIRICRHHSAVPGFCSLKAALLCGGPACALLGGSNKLRPQKPVTFTL